MLATPKLETEMVACALCGGRDFEHLCSSDRYRMGIRTSGCRTCGLLMTNPQPTKRYLDAFYKEEYRRHYQKTDRPSLSYIRGLKKDQRSEQSASYILENITLGKGAAILDVGASEGCMLHAIKAKRADLNAHGVEPNPAFRAFAEKHVPCTTHEDLESVSLANTSFDLIMVNHVFEHIKSPAEFLKQLSKKMRNGAKLYIEVPDVTRYVTMESLHIAHLFHYSEKTLQRILTENGFDVAQMQRYAPIMHPSSIRVIAEKAGKGHSFAMRERSIEGWEEIRMIGRKAWRYHLLRALSRRAFRERWHQLSARFFGSTSVSR